MRYSTSLSSYDVIIFENQLSPAHNILVRTTKLKYKTTTTKAHTHDNKPKQLLLKASSYLSIRRAHG